jgi:hypothetical protein
MTDEAVACFVWNGGNPEHVSEAELRRKVGFGEAVGWVDVDGLRVEEVRAELVALGQRHPPLHLSAVVVDQVLTRPATGPTVASVDGARIVRCAMAEHDGKGRSVRVSWLRVVASEGCVLTVRWPATELGTDAADQADAIGRAALLAAVAQRGGGPEDTAHDLGTFLVAAAAESLAGAARSLAGRALRPRGDAAHAAIVELLGYFAGTAMPDAPAESAWFTPSREAQSAHAAARSLDEEARRLVEAEHAIVRRAEAELAAREERRTTAVSAVLGTVAAVFLGPTLVATVLSAFPGWLPEDHRDDAMVGLSLASAGVIWLLLYVAPLFIAAADRRITLLRGAAIAVGAAATVAGTMLALPLAGGSDDTAPTLSITCPSAPVAVGDRAQALVAASDADSELAVTPPATKVLATGQVGAFSVTQRVEDRFGHATSAACVYRVVANRSAARRGPR